MALGTARRIKTTSIIIVTQERGKGIHAAANVHVYLVHNNYHRKGHLERSRMAQISRGVMSAERNLLKTMDYNPWFSARNRKFYFRQKRISSEMASQEEQNGANFMFVGYCFCR